MTAKLRIADHLATGPKNAEQLAHLAGADPDRLFRLLRALSTRGVFALDGDGQFSLTPASEFLRSDSPESIVAGISLQSEEAYRAFGDLLHTVMTGETAFDHIFGVGHFDYLTTHPEASATFNRAMAEFRLSQEKPLTGYDLRKHRVIVDVGGGMGVLLASVLKDHPHLRGILFDLPSVSAHAKEFLSKSGVEDRCEIRTGSAFDAVPEGGDVYVMSRILHDWRDDLALKLLTNCRKVMPPDGVLLLKEAVLPEGKGAPPLFERDLMMMVMNGGRERTEKEWRRLLQDGGFTLESIATRGPAADLLVAIPS